MGNSNSGRAGGGLVGGEEEDSDDEGLECSNCGHAVEDSAHGCDHCDFEYLCDDCLINHDCPEGGFEFEED